MFNAVGSWFHEVFVAKMDVWAIIGYCGQLMFTMRFVVQWLASERAKRSIVPVAFWFFSLAGGLILFIYAINRKEPVFILGQGAGLFIYIRNLWLIFNEQRNDKAQALNNRQPNNQSSKH